MTDAAIASTPASTAGAPIPPEELAAKLAARLCHDFMSPASGVISGLDLLDDPSAKDMRDEAMALIASSARKLVDHLTFARVAFGAYASADAFDARELEGLARGVFAHVRPELEWAVETPQVPKAAARALLNLAQIAAGALATGGVARITTRQEGDDIVVQVEAKGPRVRLHADVAEGLAGQPLSEGLVGRWVQAFYLFQLLQSAGGSVDLRTLDEAIVFTARSPA